MIVGLALGKKIKLADVTKFHQDVWSNLSFENGQRFSQLRLVWTPEENALLLIQAHSTGLHREMVGSILFEHSDEQLPHDVHQPTRSGNHELPCCLIVCTSAPCSMSVRNVIWNTTRSWPLAATRMLVYAAS